jgi:ABC-2 type transport system ATP-binding protein
VSAIRTEGLTKYFGAQRGIEDLGLDVARGEVFGYLGPNGAGKTTTIRLLLDVIRPTRGTCAVLDGSGADIAVRARVGYLPGELHLDPAYTTRDLVSFYGELHGGLDQRWVGELLDRFALDPGRRIGELSTGNRRKVGLVQAFMHRPELLLLDEPSSGLDPLLQVEFHHLVRQVVADGATVFLSSHVLHEVDALADRVAILRAGRLVTVATVDELRAQARQRIDVHLPRPPDVARLRAVPGVVDVAADGHVAHVTVEGPVGPLLAALAPLDVVHITAGADDLEDAFLRLYRDGDDGDDDDPDEVRP